MEMLILNKKGVFTQQRLFMVISVLKIEGQLITCKIIYLFHCICHQMHYLNKWRYLCNKEQKFTLVLFFTDRWLSLIKRKLGTCEKNHLYGSLKNWSSDLMVLKLWRTIFCTHTPILSNQGTEYVEYSTAIGCFSSTNTKIVL
jgi:hypothetical protein